MELKQWLRNLKDFRRQRMEQDGNDVIASPRAKTGEIFVMRAPDMRMTSAVYGDAFRAYDKEKHHFWDVLKQVIERSGGEVLAMPEGGREVDAHEERSPMYVRDAAVVHGERYAANSKDTLDPLVRHEREEMEALLDAKPGIALKRHDIEGYVEGGNVVRHPSKKLLFVGINHTLAHAITDQQMETMPRFPREPLLKHNQRYFARKYLTANEGMAEALDTRVIPLFMPVTSGGDIYHLDGVFGMLPTGEALVCRELLSRAANLAIDKYVGKEKVIAISREDALKGTTNFITVGSRVITPYASNELRARFTALGYQTIMPKDVGLPDYAWTFGDMASVRCVTLKLTEDKGFPPISGAISHKR